MSHDIRGSTAARRLACLSERGTFQLPDAEGMAVRLAPVVGHTARPTLTAADAANKVIASGFFNQLAADMTRIDREIRDRATPTPPLDEIMAKCKGPIIAMKGWGL